MNIICRKGEICGLTRRQKVCYCGITVVVLIGASLLVTGVSTVGEGYTLPCVYIDTGGKKIDSKETYVPCTISAEGDSYTLAPEHAGIRGHGNSTWANPSWWAMPKKPYKIKFDSPVDFFGNGAAKKWILVAEYADQSLSRDYMAYTLADAVGVDYVTSVQHVNLFLDGRYQGVYLTAEQVEPGPSRIQIDTDPSNTDPGFLVEMDGLSLRDGVMGKDVFEAGGELYTIKDPEAKDADPSTFGYVSGYMLKAWDAVHSGDWSRVEAVMDTGSFAKTYVIEELMHNIDVDWSSLYFHKDAGGKLVSGPLWDFDTSSGNQGVVGLNDPSELYVSWKSGWYSALLEFREFGALVKAVLDTYGDVLSDRIDSDVAYLKSHADDFRRNFDRWPVTGVLLAANSQEFLALRTWDAHIGYLQNWLHASLENMEETYCRPSSERGLT